MNECYCGSYKYSPLGTFLQFSFPQPKAVVLNLFGTRDQFSGRQFFHGGGNGSGSNTSHGELRCLACCSHPALWPTSYQASDQTSLTAWGLGTFGLKDFQQ